MYKGYFILFIFFFSFSYSQIQEYEFTKELTYESNYIENDAKSVASLNKIPNITFYADDSNKLFVANFTFLNYLFYQKKMYSCSNTFDDRLILEFNKMMPISDSYLFEEKRNMYSYLDGGEIRPKNEIQIIEKKSKQKYNEYECSEYLIKNKNNDLTVCIIENHPINNAQILTDGIVKTELKGLVVKVDFEKNSSYQLKGIKNISIIKSIDLQEEINKSKRIGDSIKVSIKKEVEAHKVKMDSLLNQEKPNVKVVSPELVKLEDKYESKYKYPTRDYSKLAIDYIDDTHKIWNLLPTYCKRLDEVPRLKNSEMQKQLVNLGGQICDMYLGEYEQDSISYKGTLDEIRKEYLNIINSLDTVSSSDKKKIIKYLNSID